MKNTNNLVLAICCVLLLGLDACKKKDSGNAGFDTKAMLTNIGSNIALPAYLSLQTSVVSLDSAFTVFNANPDNEALLNLQVSFKNSYRAWQACSVFEIGPADQQLLRPHLNTFPTDTTQINSNIGSASYNLDALANLDAQGFPALDYLLFGLGSDNSAILTYYTSDTKAIARRSYLHALITDIKTRSDVVANAWAPSGGNYVGTFQNSAGTDIGSSTGQLVNQLSFDFEILKNNEIGIPLGKQSMGALFPEKVEAYYSGISSELALLHLKAVQSIYLGVGTQGDAAGLDDCLVQLNAPSSSGTLSDAIKNQFTLATTKLQALSDPFSSTLTNNADACNQAYTELQKLTVLLKSEMPSAMGVSITYEDNDGD